MKEIYRFDPTKEILRRLKVQYPEAKFNENNAYIGHIKFDKDIDKQYEIIRQSTHDGTLLFTDNLIAKALDELLQMRTYYIPDNPEWDSIEAINYIVGEGVITSDFGEKNINGMKIQGQTDTLTIPVRCNYSKVKDE